MDGIFNTLKTFIDTFRNPDNNESNIDESNNEDVLKLKENILKIKNRRKFETNYSNIETLDNIYDGLSNMSENESENNIIINEDIIEDFQEGARNKNKKKSKNVKDEKGGKGGKDNKGGKSKKSKKSKKSRKSKKNKKTKKKSKYEQFKDKIKDFFKNIEKSFDSGKKYLFYGYNEFDKLLYYIAFIYVYFISISTDQKLNELNFNLSNGTKTQIDHIRSDTNSVKYVLYSIFLLPICLYATYNWFYLLVYVRPKENNENGYERPFDDDVRMKISLDGIQQDFIRKPLEFLLNYAITPLYWFDKIFDNKYYSNFAVNYVQYNILNYFLIFILVLLINMKFGLFQSLDYFIKNKPSILYKVCGIIIAGAFLYNICMHIFNPSVEIKMLRVFKYLFGILVTFIYIILSTFVAGMSINVSAILILLYIWIHSLFGIVLYNKNNFYGIFQEINNINSYIKKDYTNIDTENCDGFSFIEKIFMKIIKYLNDHRTLISLAIVVVLNIFTSSFHSTYVRIATIAFMALLLFVIHTIL